MFLVDHLRCVMGAIARSTVPHPELNAEADEVGEAIEEAAMIEVTLAAAAIDAWDRAYACRAVSAALGIWTAGASRTDAMHHRVQCIATPEPSAAPVSTPATPANDRDTRMADREACMVAAKGLLALAGRR